MSPAEKTLGAFALTAYARAMISTLRGAGLRDVVVSPGSRSTPFTLAAAADDALQLHVVLDERAAGFFALGLARATGRPALLLCTSGTAPAHYLPAVIEASASALPLIVLSADRPQGLVHAGSPQTIDQTRLFGEHVRFFAELGDPPVDNIDLRRIVRTVRRAFADCLGPLAGPVHLNARAKKPLEPMTPTSGIDSAVTSRPIAPARMLAANEDIQAAAQLISIHRRPMLVAGPRPLGDERAASWLAFAEHAGLPLFAESASQLRHRGRQGVLCADHFDLYCESLPENERPDLVVEIGQSSTSSSYLRFVDREDQAPTRIVLASQGFRDPSANAALVIRSDERALQRALMSAVAARDTDALFSRALQHHEEAAVGTIESVLREHSADSLMNEANAIREVARAIEDGSHVFVGNSLPIRNFDRFVPPGKSLHFLSQRGVAGIDGSIASCLASAAKLDTPFAALLGDVTFLHDIGSLALASPLSAAPVFFVFDNAGGRIFELLPLAERQVEGFDLFTTPHEHDLAAMARGFGLPVFTASRLEDIGEQAAAAFASEQAAVVVLKLDPSGGAKSHHALRR